MSSSDLMPRNLKFFYFSYQCPHNAYLLARIKTVAWREGVALRLHDISIDKEACIEHSIFSPTMLIVNDKYRWQGPFSKEDVVAMLNDDDFVPAIREAAVGTEVVKGELAPITPESVLCTCEPCLLSDDVGICRGKAEWMANVLEEMGAESLGYLHMVDGRCVGGAEFLPSTMIPYPIPDKRDGNAYLTCSYVSNELRDFRSYPLKALVADLPEKGYDTLSVVSSDRLAFPNGPSSWFISKGFVDCGKVAVERLPESELHYLQLRL